MTAASPAELMARRIALVETLTALNARRLLHSQTRAGIEVELLSCAEAVESDGETADTRTRRAALEARLARVVALADDCDREQEALAGALSELDRQLAET